MKVIVTNTNLDMSKKIAKIIVNEIHKNPKILLALPTGSTPIGCYQELVKIYQAGQVDFSQVRCMNMDEYIGLDSIHPQSYYYFMNHHLYQYVNIKKENLFGPSTINCSLQRSVKAFDQRIEEEGGIDLILLGIGRDGHIAFNMPNNQFYLESHIQKLSEITIQDNARFFQTVQEVPTHAITIGFENIFKSKKIILLASGKNKSKVIKQLIETKTINPHFPASILKLHPSFTIILDKDAADGDMDIQ